VLLAWIGWAAAGDLEGTWRLDMSVRGVTRLPVVKDSLTDTVTVGLVVVRREGERLVHTQRVCAVDIRDSSPLAKTTLPLALLASLPDTVVDASLVGGRYSVDLGVSHLGYDPARTGGALPAGPSDPAILDTERDGRPGATVRVKVTGIGEYGIEVVQRSRALLDGTFDGEAVRGGVRTVEFEQRVLGADHPLLRSPPQVEHDDAASTFSLTRLPDGATCAVALSAGAGSP
jgi:hypothetical protein